MVLSLHGTFLWENHFRSEVETEGHACAQIGLIGLGINTHNGR